MNSVPLLALAAAALCALIACAIFLAGAFSLVFAALNLPLGLLLGAALHRILYVRQNPASTRKKWL